MKKIPEVRQISKQFISLARYQLLLSIAAIFIFGGCSTQNTRDPSTLSKYYSENYPEAKKTVKKESTSKTAGTETNALDDLSLSSEEGIGGITAIRQMILIRRKGETLDVKTPYTILKREDAVLTNEKGKGRIKLTGGAEIFVTPSSNLYLTQPFIDRYDYHYLLSLEGKIRTRVKRSEKGRLQIKTSTAVVTVKGTDFVVDTKSGVTKVATIEGVVTLTSQATKKSVEVTKNQMVSVSTEGQISKPEKIPVSIIKDLSHSGETGIEELDREIKKERAAQQSRAVPFTPEGNRKRKLLALGIGMEFGYNSGNFVFLDFNLSPRSQLHYQNVVSTFAPTGVTQDTALDDLQRTINALTYRYFIQGSGWYGGLGVGTSQSTQCFRNGSSITTLKSNGSFAIAELGVQYYLEKMLGTSLFVNASTQYVSYLDYSDNYSTGTISTSEYDEFTKRAKYNHLLLLAGVGWFF